MDEALFFVAPVLVGGRTAPTAVGGEGFETIRTATRLNVLSMARVGDDVLVHGLIAGAR